MFFLNNTHNRIASSFSSFLVGVLIMVSVFVALPQEALAQVPFGGMSTSAIWCPCSQNLWITVGPPVGGSFMYQPGAMLYPFGQIYRPGVWLLGLAAAAATPCMVYIPHGCAPIGGGLPIIMVGTSM